MWFSTKAYAKEDVEFKKKFIEKHKEIKTYNDEVFEKMQQLFLKIKPKLQETIINHLNIPRDDDSYVRVWFHQRIDEFGEIHAFEPEKTYLRNIIEDYIKIFFKVKDNKVKSSIYDDTLFLSFDVEVCNLVM